MTPDTRKILGDLLLDARLTEIEAMTLQAMMRMALMREREGEERGARLLIAESDRDNRRRRMDLAMAILDETQVHDLDKVAEIIWPNPIADEFAEVPESNAQRLAREMREGTVQFGMPRTFGEANLGMSTEPVPGDPTQQPTRPGPNARCPKNLVEPFNHQWSGAGRGVCLLCGADYL
jgi:hypothetical protein